MDRLFTKSFSNIEKKVSISKRKGKYFQRNPSILFFIFYKKFQLYMKKFSLFTFALLITFCLYAQHEKEKGYVFLKNGTILKGKFQYDDSGKLRVESAGNIWVFDAAEVDSVAGRRDVRIAEMDKVPRYSRFFYRTEMGVLAGNAQNSQSAPFSFTGTVNYSITSRFSAGVGVGVEFFKESSLPAFMNIEYKLRNAPSTPYLFVKAGYQVPLEDSREVYYDIWYYRSSVWPNPDYNEKPLDSRGGILVNPGVGYSHMFSPGFGMSLAFGYQYHRLNYEGGEDYGLDIDFNRLTIKIGIIFN